MKDEPSDNEEPRAPADGDGEQLPDEETDRELLELSAPPPDPRYALVMALILVLSVAMLFWFYPDLRYLLAGLEDPIELGEAADLDPVELEPDSHVILHGLPMVTRSLEFEKGLRWFSDPERKIFPLAGNPWLLVEWRVPEEKRAYRDPAVDPVRHTLAYDFEGRLRTREQMGSNYERMWIFFDCLDHHAVAQCKHCLGVEEMESCRRRFACAELFDAETCGELLGDHDEAPADAERRLAEMVAEIERDEVVGAVERLRESIRDRRMRAEKLSADLERLASGERRRELREQIEKWRGRVESDRAELKEARAELEELGMNEERLRVETSSLDARISLAEARIAEWKERAAELRDDLEKLDSAADEERDELIAGIEKRVRERLAKLDSGAADAGTEISADSGAALSDGGGAADAGTEVGAESDLERLRADLAAIDAGRVTERWRGQLDSLRSRLVASRQRKEEMSEKLEPFEALLERLRDLPRRVREREDKIAALEEELETAESGELKERIRSELSRLEPRIERDRGYRERLRRLEERLFASGAGDPELEEIAAELDAIERELTPTNWVLVDGAVPIDSIWVVAIYLIFGAMIFTNLRYLRSFWLGWRDR